MNTGWEECDGLWRERHDPPTLVRLLAALDGSGNPADYELLWRQARVIHFQGLQAAGGQDRRSRALFAAGSERGRVAAVAEPMRVEGHYYHAANLLPLVEQANPLAAMRLLPTALRAAERGVAVDEEYLFAGPLRLWARLTHLRPLLMGGSVETAITFYRRALQIAPHNSTTLVLYSQTLLADQQWRLAREILSSVVQAAPDPDWLWEQQRDKVLAQGLLDNLGR